MIKDPNIERTLSRIGDGVTLFGILIAIDHDHYINVICLKIQILILPKF